MCLFFLLITLNLHMYIKKAVSVVEYGAQLHDLMYKHRKQYILVVAVVILFNSIK